MQHSGPGFSTDKIPSEEFGLGVAVLTLWYQIMLYIAEKQTETWAEKHPGLVDYKRTSMIEKVMKSDEKWRQFLTPEQYMITREKGTERLFTGT